ncbi:MAG TPA: CHASE domain-containing protein, partial [Candidatus Acidoferrum sp.]|nr:CHASE domain-containing protein [Candidatus Acidoferrum sp.]
MKARRQPNLWHEFNPWLVLVCGLITTIASTAFVNWTAREHTSTRFHFAVQDAEVAIQSRVDIYRALLRGGAAMMGANADVTRADFQAFVARLRLQTNYPGIQGIGFSRRVAPHEKQTIINAARADGLTNFTIFPDKPGEESHAILFLEPMDARNLAAFGYDMSSEANRRRAMERARDDGHAVASSKVTLVQEIDLARQSGFLIYSPVYRGSAVPETVEERREKLLGHVYAPFRADDLFAGIFGQYGAVQVEFDAFDGTELNDSALMHSSTHHAHAPKAQRIVVPMDIVGRPWTFVFYSTHQMDATPLKTLTPLTATLGLLVTGLLFSATLAERRSHRSSQQQQFRETQRAALRAHVGTAFTRHHSSARELLQDCTDAMVRYLPAAFARIWLLDPAENMLVLQASSGMYTHIDGAHSRVPVGKLKIGLIAAERRAHLTNDVAHDRRVGDPEWARREGMISFAGYPLIVEERVIGVIALFSREKLPPQTLETLASVADVIAHGLQRRQAEEALRTAQEKLRRHADDLEKTVTTRTQALRDTVVSLESFS